MIRPDDELVGEDLIAQQQRMCRPTELQGVVVVGLDSIRIVLPIAPEALQRPLRRQHLLERRLRHRGAVEQLQIAVIILKADARVDARFSDGRTIPGTLAAQIAHDLVGQFPD